MARNQSLHAASRAKQDEFYTQLSDIENELKHYRKHFRGKTVYCNCDDPTISNFYQYFHLNFAKLGLKKLITTCYKNQQIEMFSKHDMEAAVGVEYLGNETGPAKFQLEGDGDFRSQECIALLKQADIVVTNPPFSLFREYIAQLVEYNKNFLVIGNMNAISYKEIFPLIRDAKFWLGPSITSGDRKFGVPDHYPLNAATSGIDENGQRFVRVKGVRWFTNLEHKKRHEDLPLYKKYSPEEYPKYDNYNAINVNKVADIPEDYAGEMGVPITFLDKHNPDQFEILGMSASAGYNKEIVGIPFVGERDARPLINGRNIYVRVFIKNKKVT